MALDTSSFDIHRTFALPPEKLWILLTDAKHREKWGAPDDKTVLVVETADVRVGGQDRHRCGPPDAPEFIVDTRWYDLTEPSRAVFTETLIFGGTAACTSLVTYSLEPSDNRTELGITVATSSFTGPETLAELRHGWDGGLENLARYATRIAADA